MTNFYKRVIEIFEPICNLKSGEDECLGGGKCKALLAHGPKDSLVYYLKLGINPMIRYTGCGSSFCIFLLNEGYNNKDVAKLADFIASNYTSVCNPETATEITEWAKKHLPNKESIE